MNWTVARQILQPLVAVAMALSLPSAKAEPWKPTKPVTLIVPYAAGGGVDATARFLASELQKLWGQTVVVDNQGGADGLIGSRKAIQAKPDGQTLLVQIPSLVLNAYAPGFKGTDPVKELIPVSAFAKLYGVVAVPAQMPGTTMAEVVNHCKTSARPCSFGTTENSARLRAKQMVDVLPSLVVVNYKGGGQLITDLVANRVDMAIMGYTAAIPHIQSGAIKVVMSVGKQRSPLLPDVQTPVEAGFPDFESETWYGLFAPVGTPQNVVDSIAAAVRQAVKEPALQKSFAHLGGVAVGNTPAEFTGMVHAAAENWGALARRFPFE